MANQYPYDLYVMTSTGGVIDDNGFPTQGSSEWVFHSKCRESSKSKPDIVATDGGEVSKYSSVVVMPKGTSEIAVNTKIQLRDNGKVVNEANVIKFSEKQFHCRLWV